MTAAEQFRRYLAREGLKVTSERLAIVETILSTPGHFDMNTLLEKLRGRKAPISRATLYRTLAHLLKAGMVHRVTASDGNARYESMSGRQRHDHMICVGCGEILEFTDPEIERLQEAACRRQGFSMTTHTLRIEGHCRACRG